MESSLEVIVERGENALKTGQGLASPQIASQAGTLAHLCGVVTTEQEGFDQAFAILKTGKVYESLMKWLEEAKK
jgi:hypothetical protein